LVGAILAIMQKSSRRLLAYSSVSQVGFLLACLFHHQDANLALAYYWFGYSLGTMGLIWAIKILEEQTDNDLISSFSHIKDGSFVVLILLSVFSLIGLPLAIGFWGKLYLFLSIWQQYLDVRDAMYLLLMLVFIISTAISVYFYLKIPFYMLVRKNNENVEKAEVGISAKINALIIGALLLLLFLMPNLVKLLF
jgi:NADH-quinone oxidoreductase subunit N